MTAKAEPSDDWVDVDPSPSTSASPKARKRRPGGGRVGRTPRSDRKERIQDAYRTVSPLGSPSRGSTFTPNRISIEDLRTPGLTMIEKQTVLPELDIARNENKASESTTSAASAVNASASYAAGVLGSFGYALSTFLHLVQKPLGVLLFLILLTSAGAYGTSYLKTTYLAPICSIPGARVVLPLCDTLIHKDRTARRADFPALAAVHDKAFFPLLSEAATGSELALEMKRTQMATADLVTLVSVSPLTSRESIADMLKDFHGEAGQAGVALNRFDAKLSGAVDNILAIQDHALRQIEAASAASQTGLARVIPWLTRGPDAAARTGFEQAMDISERQMTRLVLEADTTLNRLNKLEERLDALHMLLAREGADAPTMNILAQIWALLSGDTRAQRTGDVLRSVDTYRRQARAHVAGVLQTLSQMAADMEELRTSVSTPTIVGDRVPLEVQIDAIRRGVERLSEGRRRSKTIQEKVVQRVLENV